MAPQETREIKVWIDGVRTLDPAGAGVTFESADENIATVSERGIITAITEGNTVITVANGDSTATVDVTVGG
jgi:uncharacterized protein YjdB